MSAPPVHMNKRRSETLPTSSTDSSTCTNSIGKRTSRKILSSSTLHRPPFDLYSQEQLVQKKDKDKDKKKTTATKKEKKTFERGLESIVEILENRKNVVVLVGAGISVSCGIPDFRSKGTGIYHNMDANELGLSTPEELFHFEVFQDDPRPFYKFATKMLYPVKPIEPSPSHHFLSLLERKKILLRVYTQNIDGLEEKAGVSSKKIVYAHGSLNTSSCLKCGFKISADDLRGEILSGSIPHCRRVLSKSRKRKRAKDISGSSSSTSNNTAAVCATTVTLTKRQSRSTSSESSTYSPNPNPNVGESNPSSPSMTPSAPSTPPRTCNGVMKPNITFFGEKLVDRVRRCLESDRKKADAVIVIGTSLSVAPMSKVIEYLSPSIPRILINQKIVVPKHGSYGDGGRREKVGESGDNSNDDSDSNGTNSRKSNEEDHRSGFVFDACLLGLCDEVTKSLTNIIDRPKKLNRDREKSKSSTKSRREEIISKENKEFNLLCNLPALGTGLNDQILFHHPHDRIFVYPGASLNADSIADSNECDDARNSEFTFKEVVHCDGCHKVIDSVVMKCTDCFDFDLCKDCYSVLAKDHFSGTHTFIVEE